MKDFTRNILALLFVLLFGYTSVLFQTERFHGEPLKSQLLVSSDNITDKKQSEPQPVFEAIVSAQQIALVNEVRLPVYPVLVKVNPSTTLGDERKLSESLTYLRGKVVQKGYAQYRACLCRDGYYLYTLCKMLI